MPQPICYNFYSRHVITGGLTTKICSVLILIALGQVSNMHPNETLKRKMYYLLST